MKLPTSIAAILVGLGLRGSEAAEVTLPDIFADHMVIQTDEPITLSGTVSPSTSKVELSLSGQTVTVTPGLFGDWTAKLAPVSEPGGSHTLTLSVDGTVERTLTDITFGDVWLCGGQSNMEWDMTTINDSATEIAGADYPDIRLMEVQLLTSASPQKKIKGLTQPWTRCTPATVRGFSAVGYLFGRELHRETGRPIGLIQSAWGGSRIETWIPDNALKTNPYAEQMAGRSFTQAQHKPSICYNAMIHGLASLSFKGVIWYQGENNQTHPQEYRSLMETWIQSWRDLWQAPNLPFYYVQLANYAPGLHWERLREAQTQALAIPYTGMAVTIDIGASNNIHPGNKQGTAKRLAAIALSQSYNRDLVYSGPQFRSAETNGHDITLHFDHLGSGLNTIHDEPSLRGFEVLSRSGQWSKASAKIVGDTIVIPGTLFRTDPQGVRYAWASDPEASLSNKEGFPAVPFRFEALDELTYERWMDQLVGTARLPSADADHDGVSNLMEYATAGKLPTVTVDSAGIPTLSFHQRATTSDITPILEQSSDLAQWIEIWSSNHSGPTDLPNTQNQSWGSTLTNRHTITLPPAKPAANYYRIRYILNEESL